VGDRGGAERVVALLRVLQDEEGGARRDRRDGGADAERGGLAANRAD
jgi:hypothetical protein